MGQVLAPNNHGPDHEEEPETIQDEAGVDGWYREQHRVEESRLRIERVYRRFWERHAFEEQPNRHWTAWLLIRFAEGDLGLRPIPPDTRFWKSPDVWVESSDPLGQPVAGISNFVHAKVFNLGMASAAPMKVDFYWANPALGLGPATMNFIGSEWVEVHSQSALDVRCSTPWNPVVVNDGHECLMVNCSNYVSDPIMHPFQPKLDRHVGQRNVKVIKAAPGMRHGLTLDVANVFPIRTTAVVTVATQHMEVNDLTWRTRGDRDVLRRIIDFQSYSGNVAKPSDERIHAHTAHRRDAQRVATLAASKQAEEDAVSITTPADHRGAGRVTAKRADYSAIVIPDEPDRLYSEFVSSSHLFSRGRYSFDPSTQVAVARLDVEPFEQGRLDIEVMVPEDARSGEVMTFDFVQWEEGFAIGGYTIVAHIE